MTIQDHEFVSKLFNPSQITQNLLPKVDLIEIFGFSSNFPNRLTRNDKGLLLSQKTKYEDDAKFITTKNTLEAFASGVKGLKQISSVKELKDLAKIDPYNTYVEVLNVYILRNLFIRYLDKITSCAPELELQSLIDNIFTLMNKDGNDPEYKKLTILSGRLAWAFYNEKKSEIIQEHLTNILRVDPIFTVDEENYLIIRGILPAKDNEIVNNRISTKKIINSMSSSIIKISEEIVKAKNSVKHSVDLLLRAYDEVRRDEELKESIQANQPIFGRKKTYVKSRYNGRPEKSDKIKMLVNTTLDKNTGTNKNKFHATGDLKYKLFTWLFPIILDENVRKIKTMCIDNLKKVDKFNFFSNSFEAKDHLKNMDYGISLVSKIDDRNDMKEISNIVNIFAADKRILSKMYVKLKDDIFGYKFTENTNNSILNSICEEIFSHAELLDQDSNEICLAASEQSAIPTLANGYSINDFSKRTFPEISIGVGELAILRKKWIGWSYGGIAKIINRLPGSKMINYIEHTKETSTRTFIETKEEEIETKERSDKTSKEINKAIEKVLHTEVNMSAGITASYALGPTSIEANAQFSYNRQQSKTENENKKHARDIVIKAVEHISSEKTEIIDEKVRDLISRKDRTILDSGVDLSYGVAYINDVFEFEVLRWDKRLILELYIPEPSIGFIQSYLHNNDEPVKPVPFTGTADDINEHDWLCIQSLYPEVEIPKPPKQIVTEDFKAKTEVVEEQNKWGEDTIEGMVEIPLGYYPEKVNVSINVQGETGIVTEWAVSVGGQKLVEDFANLTFKSTDYTGTLVDKTFDYERYLTSTSDLFNVMDGDIDIWQAGTLINTIPISVKFRNHHDKAAYINMLFYFRRTDNAVKYWKADVYSAIKSADEQRLLNYDMELRSYREEVNLDTTKIINDDNVRSELKKWFNKALYGKTINLTLLEHNSQNDNEFEPAFIREGEYLDIFKFDECFDWKNIRYTPLDKNLGTRGLDKYKERLKTKDYFVSQFVKSGAARLSVPVHPGNELWVLHYLNLRKSDNENENSTVKLLQDAKTLTNNDNPESAFQNFDVLVDIFTNAPGDNEFVKGVGVLSLENDKNRALLDLSNNVLFDIGINLWIPCGNDKGRKLLIEGITFVIENVDDDGEIVLDKKWEGADGKYSYLIGPQRVGDPWPVAVPSGEVKLLTDQEFIDLKYTI